MNHNVRDKSLNEEALCVTKFLRFQNSFKTLIFHPGSRDGTLGLWRISDDIVSQVTKSEVPSFLYTAPDLVKYCKNTDRVR